MRDEIDSRLWNEHRARFSEDLAGLFRQLSDVFVRLVEIQYQAPWKQSSRVRG
jgi:hypothetical protein